MKSILSSLKPLLFATASMAALAGMSLLIGCANTTTTKIYRDSHGAWIVESPKDINAQGITLDTPQGVKLRVDKWQSNVDPNVTTAQGVREANDIEASSTLVGAAVSAAVKATPAAK